MMIVLIIHLSTKFYMFLLILSYLSANSTIVFEHEKNGEVPSTLGPLPSERTYLVSASLTKVLLVKAKILKITVTVAIKV